MMLHEERQRLIEKCCAHVVIIRSSATTDLPKFSHWSSSNIERDFFCVQKTYMHASISHGRDWICWSEKTTPSRPHFPSRTIHSTYRSMRPQVKSKQRWREEGHPAMWPFSTVILTLESPASPIIWVYNLTQPLAPVQRPLLTRKGFPTFTFYHADWMHVKTLRDEFELGVYDVKSRDTQSWETTNSLLQQRGRSSQHSLKHKLIPPLKLKSDLSVILDDVLV